ncbi:hypothetical protein [uncultured Pelagimonas sp.]|uniref:hypothetical protein n=1 Tax=uncultured Pelagimonas sp. TaxID=1618102 RepID=UPI002618487F|nr:hypothetical protein [uncultured Pelagimonas sp.]
MTDFAGLRHKSLKDGQPIGPEVALMYGQLVSLMGIIANSIFRNMLFFKLLAVLRYDFFATLRKWPIGKNIDPMLIFRSDQGERHTKWGQGCWMNSSDNNCAATNAGANRENTT